MFSFVLFSNVLPDMEDFKNIETGEMEAALRQNIAKTIMFSKWEEVYVFK